MKIQKLTKYNLLLSSITGRLTDINFVAAIKRVYNLYHYGIKNSVYNCRISSAGYRFSTVLELRADSGGTEYPFIFLQILTPSNVPDPVV